MKPTPAGRKIISVALLSLAVVGAVIRLFAPNPSLARDIGTLLLVMWVPAVGNFIGWGMRQWAARRLPKSFESQGPFVAHLLAEATLTPIARQGPASLAESAEVRCTLLLDTEGFTARFFIAPGASLPAGSPQTLQLQLLSPTVALPRFQPDTTFRVMTGNNVIGQGRVLRVLSGA
jgi:hypothetical protein